MSNRETGERGEELALRHLEGKGYDALERNYRTRYGEIDLVVRRGATLVFVEVKGARVALRTRAARAQGLREARRGRRLRENSAVIDQSVGRL